MIPAFPSIRVILACGLCLGRILQVALFRPCCLESVWVCAGFIALKTLLNVWQPETHSALEKQVNCERLRDGFCETASRGQNVLRSCRSGFGERLIVFPVHHLVSVLSFFCKAYILRSYASHDHSLTIVTVHERVTSLFWTLAHMTFCFLIAQD